MIRKIMSEIGRHSQKKKRKISFSKEAYAQEVRERIKYEIREDGCRHVVPYEYIYYVYAKKRWIDRKVLDVFSDEFRKSVRKDPRTYFTEVIEKGLLTVNGEKIDLDTYVNVSLSLPRDYATILLKTGKYDLETDSVTA